MAPSPCHVYVMAPAAVFSQKRVVERREHGRQRTWPPRRLACRRSPAGAVHTTPRAADRAVNTAALAAACPGAAAVAAPTTSLATRAAARGAPGSSEPNSDHLDAAGGGGG
eukprot:scaffold2723_cov108-Isochrysis_galbana.AAC.20